MAGVLVLANAVPSNSVFTGDANWVDAGSKLMVALEITGSGTALSNAELQGSLDGSFWYSISENLAGSNSAVRIDTLDFNYVRFIHSGDGGSGLLYTVKAINPNNVQVDVDNLPELPSGPEGPAGPQGPEGPAGLADWSAVELVVDLQEVPGDGQIHELLLTAPAGKRVIAGSYRVVANPTVNFKLYGGRVMPGGGSYEVAISSPSAVDVQLVVTVVPS